MLDPRHPLHSSIVRIRDGTGAIVGAGFLAAPDLVCTCAHVVAEALGLLHETEQLPEQEVHLDFPFLGEAEAQARIQVWVPMVLNDGGGDIAVLRLTTDPPIAARPVRLLPVSNLTSRDFESYGFPSSTDVGQYAYGILRDRLANGYIQLEGSSTQGYRIQRGYSGTPVWNQRERGVVGMVVAEDRAPEAKVAFMIPNDLILHACPDIKPVTFHQLSAPLTSGLAGLPGSPLSGVEQFLRTYLGILDVPAPFGGRQAQLDELDRWLATPSQPYALLVAEAGRGKSALLAHWVAGVADERRAEVVFVPISIRFNTSLKGTTMSLLGARLRYLHSIRTDLPRDAEAWLAEIDMYLREDRSVGTPLLLVLEGADEAADWMVGRDLRFPPEPGRGIKVLVSARPLADCDAAGWVRRLEWQGVGVLLELPLLDQAGVAEVLLSMGDPLERLVAQIDSVSELHRLSEGEPMLVRLYVEALRGTSERAGFLTPEDLRHLKPGLQAYFDQWWDDQRRQWGTAVPLKEPAVRTLLNVLACALGPLSTDDLLALMEPERFDLWILEEALRLLSRFVVGDGKEQGYVFSHPRLNQYFYEKLPPRERRAWEQRLMDYGRQTLVELTSGELDPHKVSLYPVRYYGAHLERAGAHPDLFHELATEGWLRAWEALEGSYDGFLNDLARAWKRVETAGAHVQSMQDRGQAIGRQCRYALIVASIKSLAGNIPPALLEALVDKGVWTPIQGLAYARQIPDERQRVRALSELAPHLPESLHIPVLQEALSTSWGIADFTYRPRALAELAPHLPKSLLLETLAKAQMIYDRYAREEALAGLAPYLPESLPALQEALAGVREMQRSTDEAGDIGVVVVYKTAESRALAQATLARTLEKLASPLPESFLQEALAAARSGWIENKEDRARMLAALAPHLPEPQHMQVLQEALATARTIGPKTSEQGKEWVSARMQALVALIPHLPEPLRMQVLQEALATARESENEYVRARVLVGLAPHLPEPLLQEALVKARISLPARERAQALAGLVPHLPEPLHMPVLQEALAAARAIEDVEDQVRALEGLALYLPEPLLLETLAKTRESEDGKHRMQALTALAPHLPEPLRTQVLLEALHLPEPLHMQVLQEALAAARKIMYVRHRIQALLALVPHLPEPLCMQVLQEALAAARAIENVLDQVQALAELAPHLPKSLLLETLAKTRQVKDPFTRERSLAALAPYLPEPLRIQVLQEVLVKTRSVVWTPEPALMALIPPLPKSLRMKVLQEPLAKARAIGFPEHKTRALLALAPHLSEPLRTQVLLEALAAARAIGIFKDQTQALTALAPHLPEPLRTQVLQEALAAARAIGPMAWEGRQEVAPVRMQALMALAPYLPESLRMQVLQEALAAAREFENAKERTKELAALASYFPEPLHIQVLQDALTDARKIGEVAARAQALVGLASHLEKLPVFTLYALWCETLRILATRTRHNLLSDLQALAPVIMELGGKEALVSAAKAIIEVGRWFP